MCYHELCFKHDFFPPLIHIYKRIICAMCECFYLLMMTECGCCNTQRLTTTTRLPLLLSQLPRHIQLLLFDRFYKQHNVAA